MLPNTAAAVVIFAIVVVKPASSAETRTDSRRTAIWSLLRLGVVGEGAPEDALVDYAPGMIRKALGALTGLLLAVSLASCGGDEEPEVSSEPANTGAPSETPTVVLDMLDACRLLEQQVSKYGDSEADQEQFAAYLTTLAGSSDPETRAALLRIASAAANEYGGEGVDDVLDRQGEYLDALDNMAAECKAVGSSALQ
ncbi:hypothetical protein NSI01_49750 [Pimelobacter simplex]|nr:hypothetical protein NSI01_49750 [Pimelobacter simplex]